ncbi:phosphoribosyl-ATP diphosphatase [Stetteria hydrogenophila]
MSLGFLDELYRVVLERVREKPPGSYTARLAEAGVEAAARKLGEEAIETMIEALRGDREGVVREAADLLYHLTVLLALVGVEPSAVARELEARRRGGRRRG